MKINKEHINEKAKWEKEVKFDQELEKRVRELIDLAESKVGDELSNFLDVYYTEKLGNMDDYEFKRYLVERYGQDRFDETLENSSIDEVVEFILN